MWLQKILEEALLVFLVIITWLIELSEINLNMKLRGYLSSNSKTSTGLLKLEHWNYSKFNPQILELILYQNGNKL